MFLEALEKILAGHVTSSAIRAVEAGGSDASVWQPIESAGLLDLMLPEEQGGAALALPDLFPILECLGRHAVPLPVAQAIVARALVGAQATLPGGMLTIALHWRREADGQWCCPQLPAGGVADHVLLADGDTLLLLGCAAAKREPVGDPRSQTADLHWRNATPVLRVDQGGQQLAPFVAAMSGAVLSGLMQRCFNMALEHCNTRVQFGKSIGKFQALQQQLSVMAEHVLAAAIAAEAAFRSPGGTPAPLAAAVAKSRTSEAAALVAAVAHAVHGAIGMTDEYDLGLFTRRLHEWRMAYGAEQVWNQQIGAQVLTSRQTLVDFVQAI